ncbi:MAG: RES family NAD+ phosphorylase [Gemmatimonadetes bacterium]|nr:RES family NAD+ phosphorylase [Gemmatimonadota bacterium]
MANRPWRPGKLASLAPLGLVIAAPGGALQQARVAWSPCHRLIAREYANENLFERLTANTSYAVLGDEVRALREIADLTNGVRAETGLIAAAFAFPGRPSRFSDGSRGAYYAARALETAIAEVAYHDARVLRGAGACVIEKSVIEATLDGTLVDIRGGRPAPAGVYHDTDYIVGQRLGGLVRELGGDGIAYDSVRHAGGACAAVFRAEVLRDARAVRTIRFAWDGMALHKAP